MVTSSAGPRSPVPSPPAVGSVLSSTAPRSSPSPLRSLHARDAAPGVSVVRDGGDDPPPTKRSAPLGEEWAKAQPTRHALEVALLRCLLCLLCLPRSPDRRVEGQG